MAKLDLTDMALSSCLLVVLAAGCGAPEQAPPPLPEGSSLETLRIEEPVFVDSQGGKKWNIFGLEIVGKVMAEQTKGRYSVVVSTTPVGGGPPLHVHENEDEMFYVLEGDFEFRSGDHVAKASEGAVVVLPRGLPHTFRNVGESPGMLMNIITPGGFEEFFEEIDRLPKDQPLDREKVAAIAAGYGMRFLAPADGG